MTKYNEPKLKMVCKELRFQDFRSEKEYEPEVPEVKLCKNGHPCFVPYSWGGNKEKHLYCSECGTEIMRLSYFTITYEEV